MVSLEEMNDHPLLQKHIRILRFFLSTCGAWPTEAFGKRSRRNIIITFIILITCINISGELYYISQEFYHLDFFDLGDVYMTFFLTVLTLVRAVIPTLKRYAVVTRNFIMEFHLIHFKHKGVYYETICNKVNRLSHYFTLVMVANMIIGPVLFNLVPLYNNYINGVFGKRVENYTIQFSVSYLYPWYNQQDHFLTSSLYNIYLSYFCALLVCLMDLHMSLMAFQIIGHIKALIYDLRHVPRPKRPIILEMTSPKTNVQTNLLVEVYNTEENNFIRGRIIDFVNHHKLIVSFAGSFSELFGPMLALTYLYQLISCAILLLECSQLDPGALARYGPLTLIIFGQLAQISLIFEMIGSESNKLKDETYNMPWECMNRSNQRLVWILINRIQHPIRVTALGMVDVGVQTMVAILKTTFSYFALLQSMNE